MWHLWQSFRADWTCQKTPADSLLNKMFTFSVTMLVFIMGKKKTCFVCYLAVFLIIFFHVLMWWKVIFWLLPLGSPWCIICLHLILSLGYSSVTPVLRMSSFNAFTNLFCGLPFPLLLGSTLFNIL